MDFLLVSYIFYHYDLPLPVIATAMGLSVLLTYLLTYCLLTCNCCIYGGIKYELLNHFLHGAERMILGVMKKLYELVDSKMKSTH